MADKISKTFRDHLKAWREDAKEEERRKQLFANKKRKESGK